MVDKTVGYWAAWKEVKKVVRTAFSRVAWRVAVWDYESAAMMAAWSVDAMAASRAIRTAARMAASKEFLSAAYSVCPRVARMAAWTEGDSVEQKADKLAVNLVAWMDEC